MPWVRVDDHFPDHPKLARVGPLGWALWMAGLAYSNRNLTDGFIPWGVASRLVSWEYLDGDTPKRIFVGRHDMVSEEGAVTNELVIALLVDAGIWDQSIDGYLIHDYGDYQPTKAQVLAERAAKQAAGRAGGLASAAARGTAPAQAESKPVPVPKPVPLSPVPLRAIVDERDLSPEERQRRYDQRQSHLTGVDAS